MAGGALVEGASEDDLHREDAGMKDIAGSIDILKEELKGPQSLLESAFEKGPFLIRENLREHVALPGFSASAAIVFEGEGDAHFAHDGLKVFVEAAQSTAPEFAHVFQQRAVNLSWLPIRTENFIPCGGHSWLQAGAYAGSLHFG